MTGQWRKDYDSIILYSTLGFRPLALKTYVPMAKGCSCTTIQNGQINGDWYALALAHRCELDWPSLHQSYDLIEDDRHAWIQFGVVAPGSLKDSQNSMGKVTLEISILLFE